jgi:hypothetical protein
LDPTWHDLLHDTLHEFLHVDGKIFRTLRKLFFQPGELTVEHIRGRRARYIGALRLYLTMSLVFFALTALVPNPNPDVEDRMSPEAGSPEVRSTGRARGWARVREGLRLADKQPERVSELLSHVFPRMMFVLVPIFALFLKLAYRNRKRRYPQLLYFSLHFHAAIFAWLILTVPLQTFPSEMWLNVAQGLVILGGFGYLVIALRRVFGGTFSETVWRASVVSAAYGTTLVIAIAAAVVASLYSMATTAH